MIETHHYRKIFFQVWEKIKQHQLIIDDTELVIARVIEMHPEYHHLLSHYDRYIDKQYRDHQGDNPFLHMGMHISIKEQVKMDEPSGIRLLYQQLSSKLENEHQAEHEIGTCFMRLMWHCQQHQQMPDFNQYLHCVRSIFK